MPWCVNWVIAVNLNEKSNKRNVGLMIFGHQAWCSCNCNHVWNGTYGVVSWPPPWVPVLKKMPAGLPARLCSLQSPPVASKNAFICAAIIPNLVGNPKRIPSASASSCGVMTGTSGLGGAPIFPSTSSGRVSGT